MILSCCPLTSKKVPTARHTPMTMFQITLRPTHTETVDTASSIPLLQSTILPSTLCCRGRSNCRDRDRVVDLPSPHRLFFATTQPPAPATPAPALPQQPLPPPPLFPRTAITLSKGRKCLLLVPQAPTARALFKTVPIPHKLMISDTKVI